MSVRANVLLWAQRVVGRKGAAAYQVLEIAPDAGVDEAQEAFYGIARLAHPDLHRTTLTPDELELVTTAYARAAAAYQEFRGVKVPSSRIKPVRAPGSSPAIATTVVIPTSGSPNKADPIADEPSPMASPPMTSKARVHYRKAELCLRRGDLTQAVLHLKMAIVSDPQSAFLRSALAEVEAEVGKKP
jgi:hypothetical protein